MINTKKLFLSSLLLIITTSAYSRDLPIKLHQDGELMEVINNGRCTIYKFEVSTLPPQKKGFVNRMSTIGAVTLGIGSFSRQLDDLERGESFSFEKSSLFNADGKKLNDEYIIGKWLFNGSYCGDDISNSFSSEDLIVSVPRI